MAHHKALHLSQSLAPQWAKDWVVSRWLQGLGMNLFVARSWTYIRLYNIMAKDLNPLWIWALNMSYFKHYKKVGDFIGFL